MHKQKNKYPKQVEKKKTSTSKYCHMNILIVYNGMIPATLYGGTERVIWYLGQELVKLGHQVTFLVTQGSSCPFAKVIYRDPSKPISNQIPENTDVVHFNMEADTSIKQPYIVTEHGNRKGHFVFDRNTVFVSQNHAERYNSKSYVHNGLNWDDYGTCDFNNQRKYFHFLGKAAWRIKNVKGAIEVIKKLEHEKLYVLGGNRLNIKMGFRFTLSPRIRFKGMVGGEKKNKLLNESKGLIFPVRWHEPFGLAITESLYFGAPVFGTPYGSLSELVTPEVGYLSNRAEDLAYHIKEAHYNPQLLHEYASDRFNAKIMTKSYLDKYENVLNGYYLNEIPPSLKEQATSRFLDWE